MVKRAQRKFILITMSILLVVFSTIYFSITAIIKYSHSQFIENSLDETFELTPILPAPINKEYTSEKIIIVNGKVVTGEDLPYFKLSSMLYDNAVVNLNQYGLTAGQSRIYNNNFFYKFYSTKDGVNDVFIATEISENLASVQMNSISAFVFLTIVYSGIFFIVWWLSSKVFLPIKNTLDKQKQFISDASHELKTPLTIISANADVLKQNGENSQYLDNIKSQTERMDTLVADMLSLAKIDEGRITVTNEPFDISEAVTECVLPFDALAYEKNKNLIIDIAPDVVYCGDRASVKKITNILMDNAIKYSDGEIKVTLRREGGKIVALSVYNSGSNVKDKNSNRVFERFYSGENSHARERSGSGLGLSIAKGIADANKWKISAESVYGVSMKITVLMKIKSA